MTHEANNSNSMALLDDAAFCATVNKAKLPPQHFSATAGRNDQDVRMTVGRWSVQDKAEWECGICTYLNQPLFLSCEMCGQARPAGASASSGNSAEATESATTPVATEEVVLGGDSGGGNVLPTKDEHQSLLEEEQRMLKQERIKEIMALQQGIFNKIREENEEREIDDLEGSFAWLELEDTPANTTTTRVSCGGGFPIKGGGHLKKPPPMDDASSSTITTAGMSSFSGSSRYSLDWSGNSQHSRNSLSCSNSRRSTVSRNSAAIPENALASLEEETAQTTIARSVSLGGSKSHHHQNMPPVARGCVDLNPQSVAQTSLSRSVSLGSSSKKQHPNMPQVERGYVDFNALKAAVEGVSVRSFAGMEDESNHSALQLKNHHSSSGGSFGCVGDSTRSLDIPAVQEPRLHDNQTRRRRALPASANALGRFNERYHEEKQEEEEHADETDNIEYGRSAPCGPASMACTPLRRALEESLQGPDMELQRALDDSRHQHDLDKLAGLEPVMRGGLRSAAGERAKSVPSAPIRRVANEARQQQHMGSMSGMAPVLGVNTGIRSTVGERARSVPSTPIHRAADTSQQRHDSAALAPVMGVNSGIRSKVGERARSVPCAPIRRVVDEARQQQSLDNLPELAPVMGENPGIRNKVGERARSVPSAPIRRADEARQWQSLDSLPEFAPVMGENPGIRSNVGERARSVPSAPIRRVTYQARQQQSLDNLPELSPVRGANPGMRGTAGASTSSVANALSGRARVETWQRQDLDEIPDLEPIIGAMAVKGSPAQKDSYKERMLCVEDQEPGTPNRSASPPRESGGPRTLFSGMNRAHRRPEERASLPPTLPRMDGQLKIPSPSLVPTDKKNVLTSPRDPVFGRNLYTDRNREAANKARSTSPKAPKARKEKSHSVAFPLMGRLLRKKSQKD